MKLGISNWSIGRRIALALALPMLALLGLALLSGASQYEKARSQKRARTVVEFATVVNTLVHALQLERGTATALLSSNKPTLAGALQARHDETDLARARFTASVRQVASQRLPPDLKLHMARAHQLVDGIDVVRAEPPQASDPVFALINQYAAVVASLMQVTQELLQAGNFQTGVGKTLQAYTRLMQAKEYAGLERALGVAGFASNHFEPGQLTRLLELGERQSMYLDSGLLFSDSVAISDPQGAWTEQQAQALTQMRQAAQSGLGTGKPGGISADRWFALTTARIELMRVTEQRLAQALVQQAILAEASAMKKAWWVGILALSASVVALWLAWRLAQDIIHPLRRITAAMRHLVSGEAAVELVDDGREDEVGEMTRAVGVLQASLIDVVRAQAQLSSGAMLRRKESYQRALLNNFPFQVWLKDTDGVFLAANKAVSDSLGLASPDALVGKTDAQLRAHEEALRIRTDDLEVMRLREPRVDERQTAAADKAEVGWVETWKAPVIDEQGQLLGTVGFSRDITRDKLAQHEIRQLALYDALTGVPNRRLLHDRLSLAIVQCRRDQSMLALIFIDLDRFKPVNDTLGHAVGDLLLTAVARRIQACVREADTVARVGGDEFVVLLTSIEHERFAMGVAEKIRASLNEPFELAGPHTVSISSSSGVAMYPVHGQDESQLSHNADLAMYQAKQEGRNRVCLFSPEGLTSST